MKRLYLSPDRGAGALAAALLSLERAPQDCPLWGQAIWEPPGKVYWVGRNSRGMDIYICGGMGDPAILNRTLVHMLPLAGGNPLNWDMIQLGVGEKQVDTWPRFFAVWPKLKKTLVDRGRKD